MLAQMLTRKYKQTNEASNARKIRFTVASFTHLGAFWAGTVGWPTLKWQLLVVRFRLSEMTQRSNLQIPTGIIALCNTVQSKWQIPHRMFTFSMITENRSQPRLQEQRVASQECIQLKTDKD